MTIVQITYNEGELWQDEDWEVVQLAINNAPGLYAAVKFGENIYDFILADHNRKVSRMNSYWQREGGTYREPYVNPWRRR